MPRVNTGFRPQGGLGIVPRAVVDHAYRFGIGLEELAWLLIIITHEGHALDHDMIAHIASKEAEWSRAIQKKLCDDNGQPALIATTKVNGKETIDVTNLIDRCIQFKAECDKRAMDIQREKEAARG